MRNRRRAGSSPATRIVGAVLLYLIVGVTFVVLYGFIALATPAAFTNLPALHGDFAIAGNLIYFSFLTLMTTGHGDIAPCIRMHQARQRRGDHRSNLSGNFAGAARDA
jgi:hypothetical protein